MDKLPVGQLPDLQQSNNDDEIMVITNSEYSQLKKEKISDLITDFTSTNENNALTKGTDGKMFVTDFGNASNITEGTLPTSVLPEIPLEKIPDIPKDKLPQIETDDLPDSGITAGTYTYPTDIVINSKGQVTSITEGQAGANNANQDLSNLGPLGLDKLNQSKALETGSVSTDVDVYADIQKYAHSTFDKSKFTVVGSPTITDDGILDCKSHNFVKIPFAPQANTDYRFDITFEIDQINLPGDGYIIGGGRGGNGYFLFELYKYNSNISLIYRKSDPSQHQTLITIPLSVGVWNYFVKFNITTKSITIGYKTETQEEYTTQTFTVDSFCASTSCNIGDISNPCSIDLKHFSITVDGKEVFNGNKTGIDVIKPDNYKVVGNPVITDDGIASGFSASNYLTIPAINFASNWELKFSFILSSEVTASSNFRILGAAQGNPRLGINIGFAYNKKLLHTWISSGTTSSSSWDVADNVSSTLFQPNITYYITLQYKSGVYSLRSSTDNTTWKTEWTKSTPTLVGTKYISIGAAPTENFGSNSSIDLNSIRIWVDGNLVYQPCLKIPYTLSKTGSKIVDAVYRDRVQDMYEQYGYAPYYTIDEENQNFTLPMGEIYGMIERSKTVNPCTLLESKWTDYPIFSPSWLLASETYLSQGAYPDVYAALEIEYDTTKIVGASYQLPSGGYYIKRGVEVALATPPAPTVSATDGWTNPNNAFDDNAETYASCYTTTDYIELTYPAPVWVGGFTGTGNFVSGQAQATPLDMYIVDSDDIETLLCNGSSAAATAPYTSTGTCEPVLGTKFRFKLQYVNSSNPTATYPTRYTNIEVTLANPDTAFILNQTEKTFRTPLTTRTASGKAVVGNRMALGLLGQLGGVTTEATFAVGEANNYLTTCGNYTTPVEIGSPTFDVGKAGDNKVLGIATDPKLSGIITADKDLYLYFYVGDVIKNVGEVNASELAGLLPMFEEVGGKLSLPDVHRYVDLTLGSSGSVYTSPADGWVGFSKISAGNNQYVALYAGTEAGNTSETYYGYEMRGTGSGNYLTVMMPVQKGDQFYTTYSASGALFFFRFFYAVGDSTNVSNS